MAGCRWLVGTEVVHQTGLKFAEKATREARSMLWIRVAEALGGDDEVDCWLSRFQFCRHGPAERQDLDAALSVRAGQSRPKRRLVPT
jgi:hypothetical protein